MLFSDGGALRLELAQPVEGALEAVDPRERMDVAVGDDPEAVTAVAKGNQPHPVADAHQVHGALPSQAGWHARLPGGIVRPVIDFDARADAPPRRIGTVGAALEQAEPPFDQTGTPAGVDDPAGRHRPDACRSADRHAV